MLERRVTTTTAPTIIGSLTIIWVVLISALVQIIMWLLTKKSAADIKPEERVHLAIALGKMKHCIDLAHKLGIEPANDE